MSWKVMLCCAVILAGGCWVRSRAGAGSSKPVPEKAQSGSATRPAVEGSAGARRGLTGGELVPLSVNLPKPAFAGTPQRHRIPASARLDPGERAKYPGGEVAYGCMWPPPATLLVPKGTAFLSKVKTARLSDDDPIIGEAALITDGDVNSRDGGWVELPGGTQWVQVDLGAAAEVWAVAVWHDYSAPRVYRDLVIQLADDEDFTRNVRTIFNNDHDNSSGLGAGADFEYVETHLGKVVEAKGHRARYVRCYGRGSTENEFTGWVEVAVFGKQ